MKLNALIIAPEITKGMKSIGSKSLLEIKKKTSVLEYQINYLKTIDPDIHITVAVGFESEKMISIIEKYTDCNIDFIYNDMYKTTNQASCIRLFLQQSNTNNIKNILIISSGILLKPKSIDKNSLHGQSKVFILDNNKENFTLGCSGPTSSIEYIFYDLPQVWSECVYLNNQAISTLKAIISRETIDQMYLFETINTLINHNIPIATHYIDKKKIIKITNQKDIAKARVFL